MDESVSDLSHTSQTTALEGSSVALAPPFSSKERSTRPATRSGDEEEAIESLEKGPRHAAAEKAKARRVVRIERDYSNGELPQFDSRFPPALQNTGLSAAKHLKLINELNERLASAHEPRRSVLDNILAILTLYLSTLLYRSHYQREMSRFSQAIEQANASTYREAGLQLADPREVGLLFVRINSSFARNRLDSSQLEVH